MNNEITKLLESAKKSGITKDTAIEFIKEKSGNLLNKVDSNEIKELVDNVFDKAANIDLSDAVNEVENVASKLGNFFN